MRQGAGRAGERQARGRVAGAGLSGERQVRGALGARGLGVVGRWARRGLVARAGQDYALGALDLIFEPVF